MDLRKKTFFWPPPKRNPHFNWRLGEFQRLLWSFLGVSIQIIGQFTFLFSILSSVANDDMKTWILSTIKLASRTQECIEDIAANNMMMPLLLSLYDLPASKMLILDCIHALITSSNIVKQLLSRGNFIY